MISEIGVLNERKNEWMSNRERVIELILKRERERKAANWNKDLTQKTNGEKASLKHRMQILFTKRKKAPLKEAEDKGLDRE